MMRRPPRSTLFPSTTPFRSNRAVVVDLPIHVEVAALVGCGGLDQPEMDVEAGIEQGLRPGEVDQPVQGDRKSTRLNSSHANISYAVFCLKKKIHNYQPHRCT